jgi:mRNA-degrading endonuclease toxin of MazEF toxin-antitoxin module
MFKRGYIYDYEVKPGDVRPALVVSADYRANDSIINVIVLGSFVEEGNFVDVDGYSANCHSVSFAWASRMGECIGKATEAEMRNIDREVAKSLGIELSTPQQEAHTSSAELIEAKTEARIYRELYERLQGILAGGGGL